MFKSKGFTLVELLAVIVIVAVVLTIAIPNINNYINRSKTSAYDFQLDAIERAASIYVVEYGKSRISTVTLGQLIDESLIDANILNPATNEPFDRNMTINIRKIRNVTEYEVYEGPTLATGMIPVYYDEIAGVWKKADKTNADNNWFDYNKQKWANAVTVSSATRNTYQNAAIGTTILMNDINTMFVWIPRYRYKIPSGTGAREIEVMFETKDSAKSIGDAVDTYYTHPAFTFNGKELGGIWVSKFEATGTATAPTIKPDLTSFKVQTMKASFDMVKTYMQSNTTFGFTNDNDIHIMTNMEWGAVAYLVQSRYGKYGNASYDSTHKELYMNNSSSMLTGRSGGAGGGQGVLVPTYEYIAAGNYTYDGKCASIYAGLAAPCTSGSVGQSLVNKDLSYGSSTSGTIYGIYDMSGGAWDYVMGIYEPNPIPTTGIADLSGYSSSTTNSQYNLLTIGSKYYNRYLGNSTTNNAILGDSTKETSGWYTDANNFVTNANPWFIRGGSSYNGNNSGVFGFANSTGAITTGGMSFHISLTPIYQ